MDETTESNEESVDFDQLKDRVNKLRCAFLAIIYANKSRLISRIILVRTSSNLQFLKIVRN